MSWNTKDKLPTLLRCKLSGSCLTEYKGPTQNINIGGGIIITYNPGDYVAMNACHSQDFIRKNPQNFEVIQS